MKNKLAVLLSEILFLFFVIVNIINFSGCSDSITSSIVTTTDNYQARTEAELSSGTGDSVIPGAVVYVDLEHLNAPASGVNGDTGPIGEDIIPYSYTETAVHRFKLDAGALFKVRLVNAAGVEIFQLNYPGDTALVSIPAGSYKMHLISTINFGSDSGASQPVFIQPDLDAIASGGVGAQVGYKPKDLNTLLTTRKCIDCSLGGVIIKNKNLTGADLTRSKLFLSRFENVNFTNATFADNDWHSGHIEKSTFLNSKFTNVNQSESRIWENDFRHAIFRKVNWEKTSFITVDFRYAVVDSGSATTGDPRFGFSDVNFSFSTISNMKFLLPAANSIFTNVTFSNVTITGDWSNTVFDSSKFINNCNISTAGFYSAKFRNVTFTDSRATGCNLFLTDMTGTRFTNCDFSYSGIEGVSLRNAVWSNINLKGARLCSQDRTGAAFSNIQYDSHTQCWP